MKPTYINNLINPNSVDNILDNLLKLEWLQVTEARKEYFMSDNPRYYTYGRGDFARTYVSRPFTIDVELIMAQLNVLSDSSYNVCFLNRYDNQKNQLGWHSDDSPSMDSKHPIAVVSFGAEREIWWRKINDKGIVPPENRQKLSHGSCFIMPAGFQELYQHRIPKCDRICGIRVSLTFRRYA